MEYWKWFTVALTGTLSLTGKIKSNLETFSNGNKTGKWVGMEVTRNVIMALDILTSPKRKQGETQDGLNHLRTTAVRMLFAPKRDEDKIMIFFREILNLCVEYPYRDIGDVFTSLICAFPEQFQLSILEADRLFGRPIGSHSHKSFCQGFVIGGLRGLEIIISLKKDRDFVKSYISGIFPMFVTASAKHPKFSETDKHFLADLNDLASVIVKIILTRKKVDGVDHSPDLLGEIANLYTKDELFLKICEEFHYKFFGELSYLDKNRILLPFSYLLVTLPFCFYRTAFSLLKKC